MAANNEQHSAINGNAAIGAKSHAMHGVLGEKTDYPKTYAPSILYPIARTLGREDLPPVAFVGADIWHAYEVSWLNHQGVSQIALLRVIVPADSPFIVESKSFKLYLNSFNFSQFADKNAVLDTILADLSRVLQADVTGELLEAVAHHLPLSEPVGICVDNLLPQGEQIALTDGVQASLLQLCDDMQANENVPQRFYSNLLRSNCPVTCQPDWGTVQVMFMPSADSGNVAKNGSRRALCLSSFLRYILSYRQKNGFHEQCAEQIFADLLAFNPQKLTVQAFYTRRGGIDINPVRVSDAVDLADLLVAKRLVRQ